jgi:hypothetical protein
MIILFISDPPYLKRQILKIDYWGLALLTVGLGCLQILLDRGQRDDWFSSGFITALIIISSKTWGAASGWPLLPRCVPEAARFIRQIS